MKSPIGVSSFIREFKTPFNAEAVSKLVAERQNTTPEAILGEWEEKREAAVIRGDFLHNCAQAFLEAERNNEKMAMPEAHGVLKQEVLSLKRFILSQYKRGWEAGLIEHEVRTQLLHGRIDVVWVNHSLKLVVIQDWKTSINDSDFNSMLPPISHLKDNKRTSAALQLETYRRMCLKLNLLPPNYTVSNSIALIDRRQTKWIPTPQLTKEVNAMLKVIAA